MILLKYFILNIKKKLKRFRNIVYKNILNINNIIDILNIKIK